MADTQTSNEEYDSTYAKFMAKVAEFKRLYSVLVSNPPAASSDPQLKADYDSLMSQANIIQATIQKAMDAVTWVENQIKQVEDAFAGLGNNLGFLPIIAWGVAIAAMLGAIAAITYWISNAYAWAQRAHIADQIKAAGGGAGDINAALNPADHSVTANLKALAFFAVLGLVIYKWS